MHTLFELYLAPGHHGEGLITQETLDDTQAQVMTREQAEKVGFSGLPAGPEGIKQLWIVVGKIDERRIMNHLEASPQVAKFTIHAVDI